MLSKSRSLNCFGNIAVEKLRLGGDLKGGSQGGDVSVGTTSVSTVDAALRCVLAASVVGDYVHDVVMGV